MHHDVRGLAVTAASAEAVEQFDRAIASYLGYRLDTPQHVERALAADPAMPLAHAFRGYQAMLSYNRANLARAGEALAAARFFLLGLIPVIGTAPASVLSFSFSALLLTQEFAGLPMARQLVSYRGRWRMVWRYKWLSLGFGSSTMVMLVVPGINLVLLPVAAVGGTLLYCDLAMAGGLREVESR